MPDDTPPRQRHSRHADADGRAANKSAMMRRWIIAALLFFTPIVAHAQSPIPSLNTIGSAGSVYPLPDPALTPQWLWMTQQVGGINKDFKIDPLRLGAPFVGSTAPHSPFTYQLWWNTGVIPTALEWYNGSTWNALVGASMTGPTTTTVGDVVLWNSTNGSTTLDAGSPLILNVMDKRFAGGAKCDGSTNDSAAFVAAEAALTAGGSLYVPSTGHGCLLSSGFTMAPNTSLIGDALTYWPGLEGALSAWTAHGSWLVCGDLVNPCVTISNVGDKISRVNFGYVQPTPGATWSPTIYPYTIAINGSANFWGLEDITILAATHCIDIEGPSSGVAGIYSYLRNINFNGCFNVGTRFSQVDDTLYMSNLRYTPWWYDDNPAVVAYMETHKVDWDVQYLANAQADGVEFFQSYRAIQLRNGSVTSGFGTLTFAASNLQMDKTSFNEVCQAISTPNGNGTVFSGLFNNTLVYADTTTSNSMTCAGLSPVMIDLSSDLAGPVAFNGMNVGFVQTLMAIGHGTGGIVKVSNADVTRYSAFGAGANLFKVSANSSFVLSDSPYRGLRGGIGAAAMIGPGVDGTQGYQEPLQIGTCNANGDGAIDGCVQLNGSQDSTHSGEVAFFLPNGTRTGFLGRSANTEVNLSSDAGQINLFANGLTNTQPATLRLNSGNLQFFVGATPNGSVFLQNGSASTSGSINFMMPNGTTRAGFIGQSTAGELNIASDTGAINLFPLQGSSPNVFQISSSGGNLIVKAPAMPTTPGSKQPVCVDIGTGQFFFGSGGSC